MSGMTPEGLVKKRITRLLKDRGAWYCMPQGSIYGRAGVPDYIVCYRGAFLAIEAKAANGRLSPMQCVQLDEISSNSGRYVVVRGEDQVYRVRECLDRIDRYADMDNIKVNNVQHRLRARAHRVCEE